ncbi:hypothetical protein BH09MYX1_BH09MYX1_12590 [soil metagenome]
MTKSVAAAIFVVPLVVACSGAAAPPPKAPTSHAAEPRVAVTTTTEAPQPKSTPAPFTGSFDVVSINDGTKTEVMADVMKKGGALGGRMTYEFGSDMFTIGMWQVGLASRANANDATYSLCSTAGSVAAHWEGMKIVLASPISTRGATTVLRETTKTVKGATTRSDEAKDLTCNAKLGATWLELEVVEKDANGPLKLHAKTQGAELDLVRGTPIDAVVPRTVVDAFVDSAPAPTPNGH